MKNFKFLGFQEKIFFIALDNKRSPITAVLVDTNITLHQLLDNYYH